MDDLMTAAAPDASMSQRCDERLQRAQPRSCPLARSQRRWRMRSGRSPPKLRRWGWQAAMTTLGAKRRHWRNQYIFRFSGRHLNLDPRHRTIADANHLRDLL